MAGKKKGKKVRKQEKKIIDEYQLRRDLREQAKTKELVQEVDLVQEIAMSIQDEPRYSEDIRIGGIEG